MKIEVSSHFKRKYKKLLKSVKEKAKKQELIFKNNPFDSRLATHKLHGIKKDEWAYSVNSSYRITFVFLEDNKILYTDIGTHDELY
ncbi:MAG: type II toxin-antitoxin system mRNA interferase toxin, RelE/StbE family [Patescibacteria group bacterium]